MPIGYPLPGIGFTLLDDDGQEVPPGTRTRLPPRLTRAICRTVWFLSDRGMPTGAKKSGSHTDCGLAAQVGIQSPASGRWA